MAITWAFSWNTGEESIGIELETDADYSPDIVDDMRTQATRALKEAMNDPTVITPRVTGLEEYETETETDE